MKYSFSAQRWWPRVHLWSMLARIKMLINNFTRYRNNVVCAYIISLFLQRHSRTNSVVANRISLIEECCLEKNTKMLSELPQFFLKLFNKSIFGLLKFERWLWKREVNRSSDVKLLLISLIFRQRLSSPSFLTSQDDVVTFNGHKLMTKFEQFFRIEKRAT